jgi:hypothetical protein
MPTIRAFSSVAHNTAHHAASSMSWLHPHSCQAARAAGLGELRFNLLVPSPLSLASISEPLRMASEGFQKKFIEILEEHGFAANQLTAAVLVMSFPSADDYYCLTTCRLETTDGKLFEKSSSSLG